MPKKHSGLTIEEHKQIGIKMKQLDEIHREILKSIWTAYGKSSKCGQAVRSIVRLGTFQTEMDNIVCRETSVKEWQKNDYGRIYF